MGESVRSPLCSSALTVEELTVTRTGSVLLLFAYRPNGRQWMVSHIHRVKLITLKDEGADLQVMINMMDIPEMLRTCTPWSLGLAPDPKPNRQTPGVYVSGVWLPRILVRPQDAGEPPFIVG
jgi:hypothetical protein